MSFYKSLAFKNAILYLVIFLIGLGIMGYLLLDNSSKRIIQTAENQLLHSGDIIEVQFIEYIDGLKSHLEFLSQNPVLLRYLKQNSLENYDLLANEFLTLISSNSGFSQIRFLGSLDGMEIVRVDQKLGVSEILQKSQLQTKKDRPYFKNTIHLSPSDIYFSPIDLNREFGEISIPFTPTLRLAAPVYLQNDLEGVIVINTDLTNLFKKFKKSVGADFTLRMVNEEGFYLLHEHQDSVFTFERSSTTQQVEDELLFKKNQLVRRPKEIISIHKTSINHLKYDVFFQIIANRSQLLKPYYEWRNRSIFFIFFIALLFAGLAFVLLRRQSRNLKRVTNNMKQFPINLAASELPTSRQDEIGDLARSFEEMAQIIKSQMKSIEMEKLKAEKAEKEKSNFIENISHEIRNPLQSIIGLSHILEQNKPNPNQIEILKSIRFNTNNLNALVNSILDYQNVITGNVLPEKTWTDLNKLIHELITGIRYSASQKNIFISKIVDNQLDRFEVNIDSLRITQILSNLLTNAITHTPSKGEIILAVDLIFEEKDQSKVKFTVTDNGLGMTLSELTRIKERYFTKTKEKHLGTNFGLGLTIVHELLSLMNSSLTVESEKNSGSKFSFEVYTSIRKKVVKEKKAPNFDVRKIDDSLLIIDDDDQILALYQYFFKELDADYIKSFDELPLTASKSYDIIIADFHVGPLALTDRITTLKQYATDRTCLIVVSGTQPDLSGIESFFPEVIFVHKPIDQASLMRNIMAGRIFVQYGKPVVDNIKKDYDYQDDKYKNAIVLLLEEWKIYENRLMLCIRKKDIVGLEEVLHKFNNTLRRLNLTKFEEFLLLMKKKMIQDSINVEGESEQISQIMDVYYQFIQTSMD